MLKVDRQKYLITPWITKQSHIRQCFQFLRVEVQRLQLDVIAFNPLLCVTSSIGHACLHRFVFATNLAWCAELQSFSAMRNLMEQLCKELSQILIAIFLELKCFWSPDGDPWNCGATEEFHRTWSPSVVIPLFKCPAHWFHCGRKICVYKSRENAFKQNA